MAKIFSQAQMDEIYAYFKDKMNSLECIKAPELKPFDECTWDEVLKCVDAYYNGLYSLEDITNVWSIGNSKNITTSATSKSYGISAMTAITRPYAIIDFNHDNLAKPINGKEKALLTLAVAGGSSANGGTSSILSLDTRGVGTIGDWSYWDTCYLNQWLNNSFYNALPTNVKNKIKEVNRTYNALSNNKSNYISKIFLPMLKEVFGNQGSVGTQYPYYTTVTNRYRKTANYNQWWFAERHLSGGAQYWNFFENGNLKQYASNSRGGITPHFCL